MPFKINPVTGQLDYYEVSTGGGGGGATNLTFVPGVNNGTVVSDSGTDATILAADATNAGLMLPAEKTKLAVALISEGVTYLGAYNNGADYTYGDVVLYYGQLYKRISNPNNPGYPPGGSSWGLFDVNLGSPAYDLWINNALDNKVDVVSGMGLSTEDYTTTDAAKLAGIAAGAEVNVNADWNATTGDAKILNKPVISGTNTGDQDLSGLVVKNAAITGATKTKVTYDTKGLVTSGADATTADIADSTNKRYVTDANLVVIGNTSGTNTGDNAVNSLYSGLATSKQDAITLTTTGTSGAATLVGSTLNIPQYSSGSGTVPQSITNASLIFYSNNC